MIGRVLDGLVFVACALRGHPLEATAECECPDAGAGFALFMCPCGSRLSE